MAFSNLEMKATGLHFSFSHFGVTLQQIKYYYVIFGLIPIVLSALYCRLTHFHCSDPGYQIQEYKDTVTYII